MKSKSHQQHWYKRIPFSSSVYSFLEIEPGRPTIDILHSTMDVPLPPLPEITDQDLVLSVFVYHEEMLGSSEDEQYNEAGRLAQLGRRVIDQAITFHYFKKRNPVLSAEQIDVGLQTVSLRTFS